MVVQFLWKWVSALFGSNNEAADPMQTARRPKVGKMGDTVELTAAELAAAAATEAADAAKTPSLNVGATEVHAKSE